MDLTPLEEQPVLGGAESPLNKRVWETERLEEQVVMTGSRSLGALLPLALGSWWRVLAQCPLSPRHLLSHLHCLHPHGNPSWY